VTDTSQPSGTIECCSAQDVGLAVTSDDAWHAFATTTFGSFPAFAFPDSLAGRDTDSLLAETFPNPQLRNGVVCTPRRALPIAVGFSSNLNEGRAKNAMVDELRTRFAQSEPESDPKPTCAMTQSLCCHPMFHGIVARIAEISR
jgi:hypothetical protein